VSASTDAEANRLLEQPVECAKDAYYRLCFSVAFKDPAVLQAVCGLPGVHVLRGGIHRWRIVQSTPRNEGKDIINRLHYVGDNTLVAETEETLHNLIHRLWCCRKGVCKSAQKKSSS